MTAHTTLTASHAVNLRNPENLMSASMDNWLPRHRFTVDDYCRMAEVGVLEPGARIELIEGQLIDMADREASDFAHAVGERRHSTSIGVELDDWLPRHRFTGGSALPHG